MIFLKAILEESGHGIIEKDGVLFHVEPPYDLDSQTFIDGKNFQKAVTEQDFKEADLSFDSLDQLTDYILEQHETWKLTKSTKLEAIDDRSVLHNLPPPLLDIFVSDLENELLVGNYKTVIDFAKELLINNNKDVDDELDKITMIKSRALELAKNITQREIKNLFCNIEDESLKLDVLYSNCIDDIKLFVPSRLETN